MAALALGLRHEKAADAAVQAEQRKLMTLRARAFYCDAIGMLEAARPRPDFLGLEREEWINLGNFAYERAAQAYDRAIDEFGEQSTLPILAEIRGNDPVDSAVCVDPLPSDDRADGDQQ